MEANQAISGGPGTAPCPGETRAATHRRRRLAALPRPGHRPRRRL